MTKILPGKLRHLKKLVLNGIMFGKCFCERNACKKSQASKCFHSGSQKYC